MNHRQSEQMSWFGCVTTCELHSSQDIKATVAADAAAAAADIAICAISVFCAGYHGT